MSTQLRQWQLRREQILEEMGQIDCLCRGNLSEQYFKSKKGGTTAKRGPYYVLQRWFQGKNLCERIPAEQVEPVRQSVRGFKRFQELADEFVDVSEQITQQTGGLWAVKKNRITPPIKSDSEKRPAS